MTLSSFPADTYCSEISRQVGEPLHGTAVSAEVWFLLEYAGPWRARATSDNDLPHSVQAWLETQIASVPDSRLQFIKQFRATPPAGLTFFVALTREVAPVVYRLQLNSYADLLTLDLATILTNDHTSERFRHDAPLYLVCSNGKRDYCCARFGLLFYQALAQIAGASAWQTTHLGGHRFAPTLLALPDGAYYGRLTADKAEAFTVAHIEGRLLLDYYRGRTCYSEIEQAADYYLRRESGRLEVGAFRHLSTQPLGDDRWLIQFVVPATGHIHAIFLLVEAATLPVYASCGKPQTAPVPTYRLLQYSISAL